MLTIDSTWEEALRELASLPEQHQESHGDENFLRAGRFRKNGRTMWDWVRASHLVSGETYDVVLGFVDGIIADEAALRTNPAFVDAMTQFLACHLRCRETGAEIAAELQPMIAAPAV